jgi:hypothetical protein
MSNNSVAPAAAATNAKTNDYLEYAEPSWLKTIIDAKADQGRTVFLIHFNIRDLVFDPAHPPATPCDLLSVSDFLLRTLHDRDIVLTYSLHSGIKVAKNNDGALGKTFPKQDVSRLWEKVAVEASERPFPLLPPQSGRSEDSAPPDSWRTPRYAIPLLTRALTTPYAVEPPEQQPANRATSRVSPLSIGLIIDYLDHLAPPPGVITRHDVPDLVETLQRWSTDPQLRLHNHTVVLLARELAAVHPELQGSDSRIVRVRISRPEREERLQFLSWLSTFPEYARLNQASGPDASGQVINEIANGASGMNYTELLDFVDSMQRRQQQNWRRLLADRRAEIVQRESGGLLVPKESRDGLESIAGYRYVREFVDRLLPRLRDGRADITGLLFAGPPGTGKSFFASALAHDAGVNVVVMRNLRNMYVGQSERNLEQVLEVARSLAPVVIFIDELDQAFANRSSVTHDGGVEQRLLGRLLEFMDDKQNLGKVIWVAASNRPDLIDAALLSRFKQRIPFLLPDQEACRELLRAKLPKQVGFQWRDSTWTPDTDAAISRVVGRFSGRELETIVRGALWRAEHDADSPASQSEEQRRRGEPVVMVEHSDGQREILVDAIYLERELRSASVGHDQHEYERQSLLALQAIPSDSPALVASVESVLPPDITARIINDGRIETEEVNRLLRNQYR